MAKTVLTEEEKRSLKVLALELADIRKQLNELAEAIIKLNEKQFFKTFNIYKETVSEKQVDDYQLALQKSVDATETEFR